MSAPPPWALKNACERRSPGQRSTANNLAEIVDVCNRNKVAAKVPQIFQQPAVGFAQKRVIRTGACTASPANLSEIIYSLAYGVSASFARQSQEI